LDPLVAPWFVSSDFFRYTAWSCLLPRTLKRLCFLKFPLSLSMTPPTQHPFPFPPPPPRKSYRFAMFKVDHSNLVILYSPKCDGPVWCPLLLSLPNRGVFLFLFPPFLLHPRSAQSCGERTLTPSLAYLVLFSSLNRMFLTREPEQIARCHCWVLPLSLHINSFFLLIPLFVSLSYGFVRYLPAFPPSPSLDLISTAETPISPFILFLPHVSLRHFSIGKGLLLIDIRGW